MQQGRAVTGLPLALAWRAANVTSLGDYGYMRSGVEYYRLTVDVPGVTGATPVQESPCTAPVTPVP